MTFFLRRFLLSFSFIYSLSADEFGAFVYEDLGEGIEITDYTGNEVEHLVIPSLIIGKPVTAIGEGAFKLSSFTGVTIPNTVTHIHRLGFQGCTSLKSITIPSSVVQIDEAAFFENYELQSITFETGPVTLGNSIFVRCGIGDQGDSTEETVVSFSEGMTRLSSGMFANCHNIQQIILPDSITEVDSQVFFGNRNLSSVRLSANLENIGEGMFEGCLSLEEIKLPSTLKRIEGRAFASCDSLVTIEIPESVVEMQAEAFQGCDQLERVVFLGDAPETFNNGDPDYFLFSIESMFPISGDSTIGTTVYFSAEHTGFTSPTWEGFPSIALDTAILPHAPWLVKYGMDLTTDLNEVWSGSSLLQHYAFNRSPFTEPSAPAEVVVSNNTISWSYYSSAPGILYQIQTNPSLDSNTWLDFNDASSTLLNGLGERSVTFTTEEQRLFFRVSITPQWDL